MKSHLLSLLVLSATVFAENVAPQATTYADPKEPLNRVGQTYTLPLSGNGSWQKVQKVSFNAITKTTARVDIQSDGEVFCQATVTQQLTQFGCSIERVARTITFKLVSGTPVTISTISVSQSTNSPGKINLTDIDNLHRERGDLEDGTFVEGKPLVVPEINPPDKSNEIAFYLAKTAADISQLVIKDVRNSFYDLNDQESIATEELSAIRVTAARAMAVAKPNKDLSFSSGFAMLRLQKQIDGAKDTLSRLVRRGRYFDAAVALLTIREYIEDRLDTYQLEKMLDADPDKIKELLQVGK